MTVVLDEFVPGSFGNVWIYVFVHIHDKIIDITLYVWGWYTNLPLGVQGALGAIIVGLFLSTQPNRFLAKRERKALANSYAAVVSSIYVKLRDHRKNLWEIRENIEKIKEEYENEIESEYNRERQREISRSLAERAARIRPEKLSDFGCYINILDKNLNKFGKIKPRVTHLLTELYIIISSKRLRDEYNIFMCKINDMDSSGNWRWR